MAFADTLRPASFRGVAFLVDGDATSLGRRTVTHQFPLRDEAAHEDLGARPRAFSVEAVLVGDDVVARAARLEAALETAGPGRLVHPWYGELLAVVTDAVRVRHADKEGRVARFTIGFERAGLAVPLAGVADTALAVLTAGAATLEALAGDVAAALDLSGALDFVGDATAGLVGGLGAALDEAVAAAGLAAAVPAAVAGTIADLRATTAAVLAVPERVVKQVTGTVLAVSDLARPLLRPALAAFAPSALVGEGWAEGVAPLKVADGLLRLADWPASLAAVAGTTVSRRLQAAAQDGLSVLAAAAGAAGAARAAAHAVFESRDQALAWRDRLSDRLDAAADLAGAAGFEATWQGLTGLRAATVRDLNRRGADLPRLATMTPAAVEPAIVTAHRLYGDADAALAYLTKRADALAARNGLSHAGFVPAEPLEVLTDG